VTPSALSRTAHLLYRLAWIDDRPELREAAGTALDGIRDGIRDNPLGHLGALQVLTLLESEPAIATFAGAVDSPEAAALNTALHNSSIKNLIVRCGSQPGPLLLSLCVPGTCYPAVSTVAGLERLLQQCGLSGRNP